MLIPLLYFLSPVKIGSYEHFLPIVCAAVLSIMLFTWAKTVSLKFKILIFKLIGAVITFTIIGYHTHLALTTDYNITTDLPLFLCSFLGLISMVFTQYRSYWMYEILLFWVFAGTTQAVLTPDIATGFPSFDFFRYWIVHLGLIVMMLYASLVLNMRPTLRSVFKSFISLQVYLLIMLVVNYLLGSNYSYLNRKPTSASVLDYFGDWPLYILVVELVLLPYFLLLYLPFYLANRHKKSQSKNIEKQV
ncbi:MAG: TIGR02206 family membrane protein [Bizionia paragorgiae]|uniref:YwaF family protein n=1 Tax=Bizionia paragorgiae TaxID=283786 RepID=UPI003C4493D7